MDGESLAIEDIENDAKETLIENTSFIERENSEDELDRLIDESINKDATLAEWQVLTHIFKAFVGAGILGLPSAIMHGGIVVGPIILMVIGIACVYDIKLLVDVAKTIRESMGIHKISYSSIAEHTLMSYGKRTAAAAKYLTDFLLCCLQLGFCCVYVVFISHNIQVVAGVLDVRIWMLIILPTLLIPSLITDIGRLAYMTTVGNVIILVGMGIIYHYMVTHLADPSTLPKFNGMLSAFVAFGQTIYAFEGIAVILPTECRLKKRESFGYLIKIAAVVIIMLYSSIGILGYLTFGDETLGSITLNLPQTTLYQILRCCFAVMVIFTYPLQLLVSVEIIKEYVPSKKRASGESSPTDEILLRAILVVTTCLLAICIPQLDNFIALVGSLCGATVGMILPPLLHFIYNWKNRGISNCQLGLDIVLLFLGIVVCVTGTISTLYSIFHRFVHHPNATKSLLSPQ